MTRDATLTDTPEAPTAPLFHATITPNASLSKAGFVGVVALIGAISAAAGLMFLAKGAWPVLPFLGLDVLLVWLAFRAYRRQARAYEEIRLDHEELLVRRVSADGDARETRFNPYWIKLSRTIVEDEGLVRLSLTSHGRSFDIAHSLSPDERAKFARALDAALERAKREAPARV